MEKATGKKVLIVDDEPNFVNMVNRVLTHQGYTVSSAADGQEALRMIFSQKPDLVLLDVMMPRMNGWQTCRRIREVSDVPIIMLTGQQKSESDIVRGLDYGADEYLIKPVSSRELSAHVRAALRRSELPSSLEEDSGIDYSDDNLTIDIARRRIMLDGERIRLTPTEFRLLALLVKNTGQVLTHQQLLEKVWGWEYTDDIDHVRIYVWHLRQKLEPEPTHPRYIITEPGVGYCFRKAG